MTVKTVAIPRPIAFNKHYERTKRVLDVVFSVLIFLPLCVIMAMIALCIRADSEGPIFFHQKRVGRHGVEFDMLKFRSMYVNCDDASHRGAIAKYLSGQMLGESTGGDLSYKQVDDPRVTRVGRFLRKTSLDELPQFLNVLRGDMALVGPRPPLVYEVESYNLYHKMRLSGKPGLTGPWQVYGRSRVPFETMVEMDIAYLHRQSLREDLKLIALTVPVMFKGRGGA